MLESKDARSMRDDKVYFEVVNDNLHLVVKNGALTLSMRLEPQTTFTLAKTLAAFAATSTHSGREPDGVDVVSPLYSIKRIAEGVHLFFDRQDAEPVRFTLPPTQALDFATQFVSALEAAAEGDQNEITTSFQGKAARARPPRMRKTRRSSTRDARPARSRREKGQSRRRNHPASTKSDD